MDHTKLARPAVRSAGRVPHGILRGMSVGLSLMAILVADPAMATRRGKGVPPDVQLVPVVQPAPQGAAATQKVKKPTLRTGRHATTPHAGSR